MQNAIYTITAKEKEEKLCLQEHTIQENIYSVSVSLTIPKCRSLGITTPTINS